MNAMKQDAFICAYTRTPIGCYGGVLSSIRSDDLAAIPIKALMIANPSMDLAAIDDLILGCTNQAGEDNRNIARMTSLLAGLPVSVPGMTVNRLCGSGMDAVIAAARAIMVGDANLIIAGGVESMTRAPFAMPKNSQPFGRTAEIYDTTIGWRFINPLMKKNFGVDSMPETAENVAEQFNISRQDQDKFALASQQKAAKAHESGRLRKEITPVEVQSRKSTVIVNQDEHPRFDSNIESLSKLSTPFRANGTVTAGNSSGVNDGAAALIIASESAIKTHGLTPIARIVAGTSVGVDPKIMGIGPVPATQKLCAISGLSLSDFDVIELNEAFAAQALACLRELGLEDDSDKLNLNGGAIALGHPLGMSGARLVGSAALQLQETKGRYALATMCVGVGQGIALALQNL
jgi:acetyl-CoA acyltransferase